MHVILDEDSLCSHAEVLRCLACMLARRSVALRMT
jgi:hypothetical protein